MVDWIPVVSQVKSLVQVIAGDVAGAKETQDNFSRQCPIVAPMRAAVEGLSGGHPGSRENHGTVCGDNVGSGRFNASSR